MNARLSKNTFLGLIFTFFLKKLAIQNEMHANVD